MHRPLCLCAPAPVYWPISHTQRSLTPASPSRPLALSFSVSRCPSAFTNLKLELDDGSPVNEPISKRARKGEAKSFDFTNSESQASGNTTSAKDELSRFAALPEQPANIDALGWWKLHGSLFPLLSQLARRYLAIPASSAASERLFSQLKLTATPARRNLLPDTLCMLLFVEAHQKEVFAAAQ